MPRLLFEKISGNEVGWGRFRYDQNYWFHLFATSNKASNNISNFKIENVSLSKL